MSSLLRRLVRAVRKGGTDGGRGDVSVSSVADYVLSRPVGSYVPMGSLGAVRVPTYYMPFKLSYDLAYNCDILRTVIRALVQETFRNGIEVRPAWVKKCAVCGTEYHEDVKQCRVCGSTKFIVPNPENKKVLEEILRDANYNDESLTDVLKAVDFDLNVVDNAYLVVIKKYYFNDKGEVVGSEVKEVVRADPRFMQLVMSRDGRPGRTDSGGVLVFCLEHRDTAYEIPVEELGKKRCPICGKVMYPAYYRFMKGGTKQVYYTKGEVLHIKKFTYGIGYGYPPVMSIWMKALILMRQDYFILMAYHLQRSPRGLLIIKALNRESVEKAFQVLMEKARINPWMVYPLVVEGDMRARNVAEWIDLSFRADDINFIEYRQELRRSIAALYGVTPIYISEPGYGGGKESMQVLVTNRAIEMEQRIFNEKVLPWLCKQIGVEDWCYVLVPAEQRDVDAMVRRVEKKLDLAKKLAELGYKPRIVQKPDGDIDVIIVPADVEGKKEEALSEEIRRLRTALSTAGELSEEDVRERERQRYYRRFEERPRLEGEEPVVRTRPRLSEQRFTGEPVSPREEREGEPET